MATSVHSQILTLASMVASKYLMDESSCFGVNIQLLRNSLETALLQTVDKVPKELVSIFLPALVEVSGYGTKILHDRDGLHLTTARIEYSRTVTMELTHCTECLCVTWIRIIIIIGKVLSKHYGLPCLCDNIISTK